MSVELEKPVLAHKFTVAGLAFIAFGILFTGVYGHLTYYHSAVLGGLGGVGLLAAMEFYNHSISRIVLWVVE